MLKHHFDQPIWNYLLVRFINSLNKDLLFGVPGGSPSPLSSPLYWLGNAIHRLECGNVGMNVGMT